MAKKKYDFSGWATRNDLRCSDGRVIRKNAFKINDGKEVPLVWNHRHESPFDILGYAVLHNDEEGVRCECYLNDTDQGKVTKQIVEHGDISSLSIFANKLQQNGSNVVHGDIKEVSVVIAGANPGAYIDDYGFAHDEDAEFEAIIYTGEPITWNDTMSHSDEDEEDEMKDEELEQEEYDEEEYENEEDEENDDDEEEYEEDDDETVGDVLNTLTEKQVNAVLSVIDDVLEQADEDGEYFNEEGGNTSMKHNVFEQDDMNQGDVLTHSEETEILRDAQQYGSLKKSFLAHSQEYGIENIDWLFPDYKNINGNGAPDFINIKEDWIKVVMNGVHHTPYSRIKMMFADITADEARAKGYIKGNRKTEEVFTLLRRTVDPQTIYKKQKLDRDDIIDITDFDVVAWIKGEMRLKLDEEIARAILIGDGRLASSPDKIQESHVIPIINDDDLYTIKYTVNPATGENEAHAIINSAVRARKDYRGSGNPVFFTSEDYLADMILLEDTTGHRIYKTEAELAAAMRVSRIQTLPFDLGNIYGFAVNLNDYNVGADKGGAVNMFEDFDIDYNKETYLIETRLSGALVKPYSAYVLKKNS